MQKSYDVKLVTRKDFPALKKLWKTVFGDEQNVIDNFFRKTVPHETAVAVFCGDKPVSSLYALECECKIGDETLRAMYIYGVSTFEEYRNQGLMRETLSFIEKYAKEKNFDVLFLVPANETLFSMYEKFGYKTSIFYENSVVQRFDNEENYEYEPVDYGTYCKYRMKSEYSLFSLKENSFNSFFGSAGNEIKCFSVKNKGYCLYEIEPEKVVVHELFGDKNVLLGEVFKRENVNSLVLRECSKKRDVPFGMTKFTDNRDNVTDFFFGVPYGG